jgi:hypothetical protein
MVHSHRQAFAIKFYSFTDHMSLALFDRVMGLSEIKSSQGKIMQDTASHE